jgi:hypothetical protein
VWDTSTAEGRSRHPDGEQTGAAERTKDTLGLRWGHGMAKTGKRTKRLQRGVQGKPGARGAQGPAGRSPSRADILAAVADKFAEIQRQLDAQLTRTGQIQAELDRYRRETLDLRHELKAAHALLTGLLKLPPAPEHSSNQQQN